MMGIKAAAMQVLLELLSRFIENQRENHFAGWPVRVKSDDEVQDPGHGDDDDNDNIGMT